MADTVRTIARVKPAIAQHAEASRPSRGEDSAGKIQETWAIDVAHDQPGTDGQQLHRILQWQGQRRVIFGMLQNMRSAGEYPNTHWFLSIDDARQKMED